ncbi:MAG: DUF512 domain-containing protein, partial [Lachnospiraceae bacterium]|nr:DUF512 domain-containing protein [Lachnospiraceae bacterium]
MTSYQMSEHIIDEVRDNSIAKDLGIIPADVLLSVNGQDIEDIFDYQYQCESSSLDIEIRKGDGSVTTYHIEKDEDEDLGLVFGAGLMDDYRHCSNKCIFCFIDQMPPGMRETLYFKDDDARLSFLQGNYITLTNMSDHDIDRIIKYRLKPINISFQAMNPELRCRMLHNRFAGEALKKVDRLYEAGITLNGQIVLCKGINDGEELEYSLKKLYEYLPVLESVSVVPVGLTKYRDGLYPLIPFEKEDCIKVISVIEKWQDRAYKEYGIHFVHASDEWYINAGMEVPKEETYDGYLQIENGVGMVRSMLEEFNLALEDEKEKHKSGRSILSALGRRLAGNKIKDENITVITGRLIEGYIRRMTDETAAVFPQKNIVVLPVKNEFFGERITVTGLLTGQDIKKACTEYVSAGNSLGDRLLLPENILRSGTDVM